MILSRCLNRFGVFRIVVLSGVGLLTYSALVHAQATEPQVKLVRLGSATIDDGKGSYEGKSLTGAILEIDLSTSLERTALVVSAQLSDGSTISAFAFLPQKLDAQVSLDPNPPGSILNLGGGIGEAPDIRYWGWNVTVGAEELRTWGRGVTPAILPGEGGMKIEASRAGRATLAVLFETTPEAVRSLLVWDATLTPEGTEPNGVL